ncbi:multidrug effflux MFS transporter [Lacticaseibacillus pabuli]|uniref:Bcr/CflA family efflux transporter n=1 Tax=Lacticaseibacillus pabuli TaxID=3025672 RepID=A0ABY7WUH3_9LACO|nr:multidrug effflux MFS transporter [Lacticaseibacillus sp. KACC 23028]WDF83108.1 multidrug effflux MFS transporter [Lacticaseibacillus sp. KACC 23028]
MTAARKKPSFGLALLLGTLSAFGPLSMDLYLPALPTMQADLHSSATLAQLTITASVIGLGLGQVLIGPLSDRYGRRVPLLAGLALFTVCSLLIVFQTDVRLLIGLRFFQGIGGSAGQVLSRSIARDMYSGAKLTSFMAVLMAINGVFPIISPSIGSLILMITSWRGIFVLLLIIGLILMAASALYLRETLPATRRSNELGRAFVDMLYLLKQREFMAYVIAQAFSYGSLFSYISGSSFVLEGHFNVPVFAFAVLYAINGLGIIVGTNLAGRLSARRGTLPALKMALYGLVGVGVWLVVTSFIWDSLVLLIVGLVAMQAFLGMINTTATSLGMNGEADRAGGASAMLGLFSNVMGGIASPIVGLFAATNAMPMVGMIFVWAVMALLSYFLIAPRRRA